MNDGRRPNTRLRPACGAASTKPIRPKQLDDAAPRWLRAVGDQPGVAGSPDEPRAGTPISASPPRLFGRHAETTALDALLDQARAGIGDALVLWGEPGIGKTALVQHVHHRAGEFVRLSHRAARAESELDFAGLHGLLRPVSKHFESLAAPQAAALRSAAGSSSEPTNPLVVGAAVLSLLCRLADKRPVLVTVDDGQWLDDATARCLGIVARRLHPHPVVIVLADQHDPAARRWEGLPELRVDGLTDASARQLLAAVAAPTDEVAVADMVAKAGGNPLALRESAGICESAEDDEHRIRGRTPIGPRMRRAFRAALDALSAPAQLLIVLAAAECDGDRRTVQRAGRALGAHDAWDEAIDTGLLQVGDDQIEFRHPIVRGAVYAGSGAEIRRRVHRALAEAMSDESPHHAWHLAEVADDRDEQIATLLERTAAHSLLRGATSAAARELRRAAELSSLPIDVSKRLADAARAAWDAGWPALSERLLDDAERLAPGDHIARRSRGLRGLLEIARGRPDRAYHYLTIDMDRVTDPGTALELGTMALRASWSAARDDLQAAALTRLLELDVDGRAGWAALLAWWRDTDRPAVPPTSAIATDVPDATVTARTAVSRLLPPTYLGHAWGLDEPMGEALRRRTPDLRRRDERARLAVVLAETAVLENFAGNWAAAESSAGEGLGLAEQVGTDHIAAQCRNSLGWLAAARGEEDLVAEAGARVLQGSLAQGVRSLTAAAYWNRGMASLFQGRPEEALASLIRLTEPGHAAAHPTFALLASLDIAEAAVYVGRHDLAEKRARELHTWARRTKASWADSAAQLIRALLGGPHVESAFLAALDMPGARSHPLFYARAQLFYGEWLRRGRRRTTARARLGEARALFDGLGAEPLRRRAQRELELTGPPGSRRAPDIAEFSRLTAQEQRVARLAAEQLTNREIAARLRISHRTVGHHLGNVFAKLGINERVQLRHTHAGHER
ncbi:AAA family ATPase [Actinoalloteichus hymeniacidonis]|uniref:Transcriptional regulator, luxR family n=1 Tax=Actinoalloteichus hymeniacidonis TaxID=340345 RepID=A0AAC9MXV2_9PSEU|nr:LuxR family transcriptional regulator [Actinoalloteichus hymeniacidonis]AOS63718.1 transcriptional regulator, luxR family [Actinoalloteichus hymeniacidonis]MBB5908229.1 DNA-binding CsgD family transcriptional regulator [Actinoalloteichus hymeniacidonis]